MTFELLILDEADRLLDLGFKDDIQKILSRLPKQRRTGLFSASVSEAVDQLIHVGLRNPVRVSVKVKSPTGMLDKRTPVSLQMAYLVTKSSHKLPALMQLLEKLHPSPQKSIVYLSTCAAVDYFQHLLPTLLPGFTIVPLHGKHVPRVREKNFDKFSNSITSTVLLTTDVAARGLDIPMVDLVIQLDPPTDPKVFLHRCGRAGRAGRKGLAVTFLTPGREEDYVEFLSVRKTPVSKLDEPQITITEDDVQHTIQRMRDVVLADRALHDKAQRGFVSSIQAYRKHQASSIFRISDVDWTDLGNAWALLRLPKMPELKQWEGDRCLGLDIDFANYKYADKAREKHRLEESTENKPPPSRRLKDDSEAWSGQKARQKVRETRREKRAARREGEKMAKMSEEQKVKKGELEEMIALVRRQTQCIEDEWNGFSD